MYFPDLNTLILLIGVSVLAASAATVLSRWLVPDGKSSDRHVIWRSLEVPRRYEFRDGYLVSDPDEDEYFLNDKADRISAWQGLIQALTPLNTHVADRMARLRDRAEPFVLEGVIGEDLLSIGGHVDGPICVISVGAARPALRKRQVDQQSLDAIENELAELREAMECTPVAMWRQATDNRIMWANGAYFRLLEQVVAEDPAAAWPITDLFQKQTLPPPDIGAVRRSQLDLEGPGDAAWFDLSAVEIEGGHLFSAQSIDRLVTAESALKNFVQTLSKTFAHLPIGLAIFDKRRQLVLFNPALVSLSTLEPEWLSARPDLFGFLDQLRERQRMPEPKNYKEWRAEISALEMAAQDGTYQDLWSLPTGQTYRVIGRPHPDGAVAFMFEDITSEVSLTRQFRADLDMFQAVLDESDEAIAVFSIDGQMTMRNQIYAEVWPDAPVEGLATVGLIEATRHWQSLCSPTPVWGDLRDFALKTTERCSWIDRIDLLSGTTLECRFAPLKGGATLVAFRPIDPSERSEVVGAYEQLA